MAVTVFYFFASFAKILPWEICEKDWGGDFCTEDGKLNATVNVENDTISNLYYMLEKFK
jgi:hypothetical protein